MEKTWVVEARKSGLLFCAILLAFVPQAFIKGLAITLLPFFLLARFPSPKVSDVLSVLHVCVGFILGIWYLGSALGDIKLAGIVLGGWIFWTAAIFGMMRLYGEIRFDWQKPTKELFFFAAVFFVSMFVVWGRLLYNSVPFKGDASFFISASIDFNRVLIRPESILFLISAVVFFYFRARRLAFFGFSFLIPVLGYLLATRSPELFVLARRYTAGYYVLSVPFVLDVGSVLNSAKIWQEWRFALVPFVCATWITIFAGWKIFTENKFAGLLTAVLFHTTPLLVYYNAIPYAELPAVLCFLMSIFSLNKWTTSLQDIHKLEVFLFLAVGLLFKETLLIPAAVISVFFFFQKENWIEKFKITPLYLLLATPVLVYLLYRKIPYSTTAFSWPLLIDPSGWLVLLKAFVHQFGILMMSALVLLFAFWKNRLGVVIAIMGGVLLFYLLGNQITQKYLGYSRYSLTFLPLLGGLGLLKLIELANSSKKHVATALLALGISLNVLFSPIDIRSGIRKPGWGDYRFATSEFDYPYDEAWNYLAREGAKTVIISGRSYLYFDAFYAFKYNMKGLTSLDLYIKTDSTLIQQSDFWMIQTGAGSILPQPPPNDFFKDTLFSKGSLHVEIWRRDARK